MVIYIYIETKKGEKIGFVNNIISRIMSKQAKNKKYRRKYISFYNLSKKPPLLI